MSEIQSTVDSPAAREPALFSPAPVAGSAGEAGASLWNRIVTSTGILCVIATFSLMSAGVQAVRAESGDEANMSIDPVLEANLLEDASPPAVPPAAPAPHGATETPDGKAPSRPGVAGHEARPGVIVLNTRGYNYGPGPGSLDPAALAEEAPAP